MAQASANGITIEYDSLGDESAETVLLVAGLGMQMIRWTEPFRRAIAGHGFRVVRFDNRDVGLSTHFSDAPVPELSAVAAAIASGQRPDVPYTLYDMADDAAALLDVLGVERAHIVGASMGGMIGQLIASEHPGRTASLTSIMSNTGNPGLPPASPEAMAVLLQRPPSPFEDEAGFLAASLRSARVIGSPGYPLDVAEQQAQALAAAKRAYDPAGYGRQIAAVTATGDRRPRLKTITAPTLVIHGAADPLVPLAGGEDTAANIKGAELKVIEGMGHDLPPALYETLATAIAANARRVLAPA